jgi:hypothetical protein
VRILKREGLTAPSGRENSNVRKSSKCPMDYFETLFGISPDSGSGALEAACISVLLLIVLTRVLMPRIVTFLRRSLRAAQDSQSNL